MIETPTPTEEHKPDGLNILASLLHKIQALEERIQSYEERLSNLTIPESTVNTIAARTLALHAQVLQAVTTPQQPTQTEPVPQEEAQPLEVTEAKEEG